MSRYRLQFKFWLNLKDATDELIADKIELLKNERQFTQTIRDGIRLVSDLRQGGVSVLCELFPEVTSWLNASSADLANTIADQRQTIATQTQTIRAQSDEIDDLRATVASLKTKLDAAKQNYDTVAAMERKLDRLEAMLIERPHAAQAAQNSGLQPVSKGNGLRGNNNAPKQLNAPTLAAPNFDDDEDDSDLLHVTDAKSSGNSAQNLINSILALDNL